MRMETIFHQKQRMKRMKEKTLKNSFEKKITADQKPTKM